MSFRIPPQGHPAVDIPALIVEQAEKAIAAMLLAEDDPSEAILAARRRFKKIRGALRIIQPAAPEFYFRENARYRDLARAVSGLRDANAHVETLDTLTGRYAELLSPHAFVSIRQALANNRAEIVGGEAEHSALVANVISETKDGVLALGNLLLPSQGEEIAGILSQGVRTTYAKARKAFFAAHDNPSDESLHDLRKRVKYHWMHVRLLQDMWIEPMLARRAQVKTLSDQLGEMHDISELKRVISNESFGGDPREIELLFTMLSQRSLALFEESMNLAAHLFAEKPHLYSARVQHHFLQAIHEAETGIAPAGG